MSNKLVKGILFSLSIAMIVLFHPTPAYALTTGDIDQAQLNFNGSSHISGTNSVTQTFIPGKNGQLTKIDVEVFANSMPETSNDLQMQLIDMDTKAILFNTTLTNQKVREMQEATGYVTFTVDPGVQLAKSRSYGIKLSCSDTTGNLFYEWANYTYELPSQVFGPDQYQNGTLIFTRDNIDEIFTGDAVFRTYMIEEKIDQSQLKINGSSRIAGTNSVTQTFIPGKNGQLTKVDVNVYADPMPETSNDLQMQLIDMDTKAILFNTTLTNQKVREMQEATGYVTFTVDPGVQLAKSKSYGIKLSCSDTTGNLYYEWCMYAYGTDQYQNGTLIFSRANIDKIYTGDAVFRTYMIEATEEID